MVISAMRSAERSSGSTGWTRWLTVRRTAASTARSREWASMPGQACAA
jgi:hypothetical protein